MIPAIGPGAQNYQSLGAENGSELLRIVGVERGRQRGGGRCCPSQRRQAGDVRLLPACLPARETPAASPAPSVSQ